MHGADDTVVDPRNAKLLANRIPDAQLMMLPALGHLFFWEEPDVAARAVVEFLTAEPESRPAPAEG
jgi:pimeloyl-ACP methyl ester carboxylesterase